MVVVPASHGHYARAVLVPRRIAAALLFSVLLAGCGSTYTKHDFISRADGICASAIRRIRSVPPPAASDLKALSGYLDRLLTIVESEASQLRALPRPPGSARDKATLGHYLTAEAQVAADYRQLAASARRGDTQAAASAEAALRTSPVAALAAGYGLRSCGQAGATVA